MRTATIKLYKFNELSDDAKEIAREWYKTDLEYPWFDESLNSIKAFCDHFGVSVKNWSIGAFCPSYLTTDATNSNFRGVKLKSIDREQMPTGYCLDCDLWFTFYDEFKRTGDAFYSFNEALDVAAKEMQKEWEYQYSDDAIDEFLTINEYEFTENGRIY